MGDWLEAYASIMELDIWNATTCKRAEFDDASKRWTVEVEREGQTITLNPAQLVLATGMSGVPNRPVFEGQDRFRGMRIIPASTQDGAPYAGKRCVVIGANNSAHDIAADLWEHGADVTMIQRSPTLVVKSEADGASWSTALFGSGGGRRHRCRPRGSDRSLDPLSHPSAIRQARFARIRQEDAVFYERLRATGFMLTSVKTKAASA